MNTRLQRNILSGYVQNGLSILFTLISYPLYLAALGREEFSIWLIMASVIGMNTIGTFGLGTALLKKTAEYRWETESYEIERTFAHSATAVVVLTVLFCCVVYGFSGSVFTFLKISESQVELARWWLLWIFFLVPLAFLADQGYNLVAGLGRYDLANVAQVLQQATTLVVAAILFLLGYKYHALPIAMAIGFGAQLTMLLFLARRYLPAFPRWVPPTDLALHRSLLTLGSQAAGSSMLQLGFHLLNRLLVARYLGLAQVPIYEIAFSSSMRLRSALAIGSNSLMPEAAKLQGETRQNTQGFHKLVRSLSLRIAGLSALCWLVIAVAGKWAMSLWLGDELGGSVYTAFLVLGFGALASACSVPMFYVLLGQGHFRLMLETSLVTSIVNISVFFLLLTADFTWMNPAVLAASSALLASAVWTMFVGWRHGVLRFGSGTRPGLTQGSGV